MAVVLARLRTADFGRWHAEYVRMHPHRARCGEQGRTLYRDLDDPQAVVVVFDWDTVENARGYFSSQVLADSVARALGGALPAVSYLQPM
ncbi:MAG: hypothetical protein ACYDB7_01215 [Mycobacteriales bacterium]